MDDSSLQIIAVVPAFNERRHISDVIQSLPELVTTVIVVDDASTDDTPAVVARLAENDDRIVLVRHDKNQGVGGAMISGFERALQLGAHIVVKFDGDGQMPPEFLDQLLDPLISARADYAKGNRFHDFQALSRMPIMRRFGNTVLSFLTKAAVGYWDIFDPCNGFVAIRAEALKRLRLDKIDKTFFFETSMLGQLYLLGAVVKDVPMPARYGDEVSHLSIFRVARQFPLKLAGCLMRRILLKNFLYDFSMESVYLLSGMPLFFGGAIFGWLKWREYAALGIGAPTGTVVISAMLIILGFQLLLSALNEDLRSTPKSPIASRSLSPPLSLHGRAREGVAYTTIR